VRAENILEVHGLSKRFGGLVAVNDVEFAVARGEILGILGPNGAGKTTVFNLLTGFIRPDAGRVRFGGMDLVGRNPVQIVNRGLARTFQLCRPFVGLTVLENVLVPCYSPRGRATGEHAPARALRMLHDVGLAHKADMACELLSYGDQRRLEVARALATEPRFILLDEPFAGIDPIAVLEIQRIIAHLKARGIGVLITDHNVRETLGICDHACIISEGRVLAQGTPAEIVDNAEVRRVYLGENFRM